jgi:hypothetical protein
VLCGRWESYPREFAKCRRCRKAKYCGKECQSTAWSEGHRFWCSAKEGDEETAEPGDHHHPHHHQHPPEVSVVNFVTGDEDAMTTSGGTVTGRAERRERERHVRDRALATIAAGAGAEAARSRGVSRGLPPPSGGLPDVAAARAAMANRPLLAPPIQQWANRSAYARPAADAVDPPPATTAPRTALRLFPSRPSAIDLDRGISPARRRAETMSAVSHMELSEPSHRPEVSRYFPSVHGEDAGPSRGRLRAEAEDDDMMTMD